MTAIVHLLTWIMSGAAVTSGAAMLRLAYRLASSSCIGTTPGERGDRLARVLMTASVVTVTAAVVRLVMSR